MSRTNTAILKAALATLRASGADRMTAPLTSGCGAIFMLHSVAPDTGHEFEPNRILRITPEFLDTVLTYVQDKGFDIVSLDEIPSRLEQGREGRPFVAITFDDGYRDNRDYALPVLRKHRAPAAIYIPSDFADGTGDLWWLALERALRQADRIDITIQGRRLRPSTVTTAEKNSAFHRIYWELRRVSEEEARAAVAEICRQSEYDPSNLCTEMVMDWDELRELSKDPLVTIGAHTNGHFALAKLDRHVAWRQMSENVSRIEKELSRPCRHISYPYGSDSACGPREFQMAEQLGMRTGVTTHKGLLSPGHKSSLTSLPRLSLNGDFQDIRYVETLLTGAPFALFRAVEQVTRLRGAARGLIAPRRLATST